MKQKDIIVYLNDLYKICKKINDFNCFHTITIDDSEHVTDKYVEALESVLKMLDKINSRNEAIEKMKKYNKK